MISDQWRPVPGNELLEMDGAGRFRRIPTVRDPKTFDLRPHPTKRIMVGAAEASKLGLQIADLIRELFDREDASVPNDLGKVPGAGTTVNVSREKRR